MFLWRQPQARPAGGPEYRDTVEFKGQSPPTLVTRHNIQQLQLQRDRLWQGEGPFSTWIRHSRLVNRVCVSVCACV